jgi:hypothetical protein
MFMEGIVCKKIRAIQCTNSSVTELQCNTNRWGRELITCLLEVTQGQWLYCNVQVQVHNRTTGTLTTQQKEEIQIEIERQRELGTDGLLEEDCYLAQCNLGDLEENLGITETYWLLAIQAAWEASRLEGIRIQTAAASQNTS